MFYNFRSVALVLRCAKRNLEAARSKRKRQPKDNYKKGMRAEAATPLRHRMDAGALPVRDRMARGQKAGRSEVTVIGAAQPRLKGEH